MRVALVNTPGFSPYSPPLGLMCLGSYLAERRVEVSVLDASIDFLHHCVNPDFLAERLPRARKVAARLTSWRRRIHGGRSSAGAEELKRLAASRDGLCEALGPIWIPDGFDMSRAEDFEATIRAVTGALRALYLPFHPISFSLHAEKRPLSWRPAGFFAGKHWDTQRTIFSGGHPLRAFCRDVLLPRLKELRPDLIGVSVSYAEQAANAQILIAEIAGNLRVPVVTGGSYFHDLCSDRPESIARDEPLFDELTRFFRPFGVLGEGERPLAELCARIAAGEDTRGIPGVVYRIGDQLRFEREGPPLRPDELPLVDLTHAPVRGKYLTPVTIAPLMTARGCYWNKCAFCDHASVLQSRWRELDVSQVVRNMGLYRSEHGVEFVLLCDEGTSPRMFKRLSAALVADGDPIPFGTMARLEKSLSGLIESSARAGCRFLSFGLESASQRVLNDMNKGFSLESAREILDECRQHGILVELFVMFGFPTEGIMDAAETVAFLEENNELFEVLRVNAWQLKPASPMGRHPEQYGLAARRGVESRAAGTSDAAGRTLVTPALARELASAVERNERLGNKIINPSRNDFRHEEFRIIEALSRRRLLRGVEAGHRHVCAGDAAC